MSNTFNIQRGEEELMNESGRLNETVNMNRDGKLIIRFRSKSKEKKAVRIILTKKRAAEDMMSPEDEKMAEEKKRKFSLGVKLKAQFDRIKIKDLKTPEKLDNHVEEKFVRERSEITKNMEKLTREISKIFNLFQREKITPNKTNSL
jgi:hypothetical protein